MHARNRAICNFDESPDCLEQKLTISNFVNLKVKSILVSQPKPETERSPYFDLGDKYKLKIDFRPFIHVEGIGAQEFRVSTKANLVGHTAVILTSRNAVDHFFRLAEEMRFTVPDSMKYFCISEATAYYLQKYVVYRKRKIFSGKQTFGDLMEVIKKHSKEKFLLPCSDLIKDEIPIHLNNANINYTKAICYRTVCSDLSDLKDIKYDMLVFFSPSGIASLFKNFPDFEQGPTRIAVFGPTAQQAALDNNLRIDVAAPMPNAQSMTMAIEDYVKKVNKK